MQLSTRLTRLTALLMIGLIPWLEPLLRTDDEYGTPMPDDFLWSAISIKSFTDLLARKVDEAVSVSFLNQTPTPQLIWLLIGDTFVLIRWVSNLWWFSHCHDDIWIRHFCKSQTTPIPLRVLSTELWHTWFLCLRWANLGGNMWVWGANQLVVWIFYNEKIIWQHFILHVTTLETWNNQIGLKFDFHWQMTHVEFQAWMTK